MDAALEEPLSTGSYKLHAKLILPLLRCQSDPPPVANVFPGCYSETDTPAEIRRVLLDHGDQFELIRGFKLLDLSEKPDNEFVWVARGCLCLRTASGRVVSVTRDEKNQGTPFIFVPSSLLHENLSDEELLSGAYQLGNVVGGDKHIVGRLLLEGVTQSVFEKNIFVRKAIDLQPIPSAVLRPYPFFQEFLQSNDAIADRLTDAAISFGMPYRVATVDECLHGTSEQEANSAETLLFPRKPWMFAPDVWVPSSRLLHATLDLCISTPMSPSEQKSRFLEVYAKLGKEYADRFEREVARAVRRETKKQ